MKKLEECIEGSVRSRNKLDGPGESLQDGSNTDNDHRCRDMDSEESTREEVGCGVNTDV